jgi:hypothetical protein
VALRSSGIAVRVIVTSAKRSCASRCADRGSNRHGASRSCGSRARDADAQGTIASTRMVDSHLLQPAVRPLRCAILGVGLTRIRRSLMALALLTKHVSAVEIRLPVVFGREPFSLLARNAIR